MIKSATNLSAAELRRMADETERTQRDLAIRRADVRSTAVADEARRQSTHIDDVFVPAERAARAKLVAAIGDPTVNLADLWALFVDARAASATRAAVVGTVNSFMRQADPDCDDLRRDISDMTGRHSFADALDRHTRRVIDNLATEHDRKVGDAILAAGAAAADTTS